GRRRDRAHRTGGQPVPRGGPGPQAHEAGRRGPVARPRRHARVPARAAGAEGHEGPADRREGPDRDAAGVLQRDGQGREARRLARGVHVRPGQGERPDADPPAHRAGRGQAGGTRPPAAPV
ncbi:MAG: hypothetical protein AVDCRST_MAG85-2704, partial [uncultured Solirubrobacteraceae bacterium]